MQLVLVFIYAMSTLSLLLFQIRHALTVSRRRYQQQQQQQQPNHCAITFVTA